ncbi:hypothetical protein CQW23_12558 [Capsicum baccatum]|uniref:Exoribonuclease phosphorolytic domain-containing protein n=1 Tax=Capsicum baccatum TaxID=33114 RepID=A0A2G2WT51_CAPBA|nr:hypothetical protein CQW23_12558 [Capsicum baccatum]
MESEFIALDKFGEEAKWLRNFLKDISYWPKPVAPVCIHCDSQAVIDRAGSMMYNGKSRHIRRRHNTVRELLSSGIITVDYVKSKDNVSDPLTKGLSREGVERTSKGMGLRPRTSQHGGEGATSLDYTPSTYSSNFCIYWRRAYDPTHHEEAVMGGRMSVTLNANGDVYAIQKAGGHGVMQGNFTLVLYPCRHDVGVGYYDAKILKTLDAKMNGILDDISVESYKTKRALRMVKRHAPSNAVDVNRPDQKAKQILEGQKLKSEECSVSQSDDMDVEQDRINKRSKKNQSFTGRPSSWDPYSEGVNTDESEATLASRDEFNDFILSVSLEFLVCGALTFNIQMRLHNDNYPNELYE